MHHPQQVSIVTCKIGKSKPLNRSNSKEFIICNFAKVFTCPWSYERTQTYRGNQDRLLLIAARTRKKQKTLLYLLTLLPRSDL